MESTKINFSKSNLFRKNLIKNDGYIHFIAIGGIGMSGLAKILIELGYKVSGSDIKNNAIIKSIENAGGIVSIGHNAENISDCSLIVVSSAIKSDNPELIEAKRQNIPIIHRAQLLESLMSGFGEEKTQISIGVTGTHGKTTTSGMTAFLFENAGINPSFAIGGQLPHFNINSKAGCGDYFISELDESDGSIELYTPDISIITNLEFDHADHYEKGFEQILETFERYINDLNDNSKIIINTDNPGNLELINRINNKEFITYSSDAKHFLNKEAVYRAETVETVPNARMKVFKNNEFLGEINLGVPGIHNISNALAAIAAALECELDFSQAASSLEKFTGMKRRFQTGGHVKGARIIDDYAHHPTEIQATLKTAKEITSGNKKSRVIAVFQPHRFTRLANLWQDFVKSFKDADIVYLCDVYPAGEAPIRDVNSENLNKEINYTKSVYVSGELEKIAEAISSDIRENDIILTMGAGSITQLGQMIIDNAG
jgi:UDP-N-acetylmuramate--alanine ligase